MPHPECRFDFVCLDFQDGPALVNSCMVTLTCRNMNAEEPELAVTVADCLPTPIHILSYYDITYYLKVRFDQCLNDVCVRACVRMCYRGRRYPSLPSQTALFT